MMGVEMGVGGSNCTGGTPVIRLGRRCGSRASRLNTLIWTRGIGLPAMFSPLTMSLLVLTHFWLELRWRPADRLWTRGLYPSHHLSFAAVSSAATTKWNGYSPPSNYTGSLAFTSFHPPPAPVVSQCYPPEAGQRIEGSDTRCCG